MKKQIRKWIVVLAVISCILPESASYYGAKVEYLDHRISTGTNGPSEALALAKMIKKSARIKKSAKYPDFYWKGSNVAIGLNRKPVYGSKKNEYIRVSNTGNKKFTICGVTIGQTKDAVVKQMNKTKKKYYWSYGKKDGAFYGFGNAAGVYFKYKNGKLKSWTYICAPTS